MKNILIFLALFCVSCGTFSQQVLKCENGPCKNTAEKISQKSQPIKKGIPFYTGHGFFIDIYPEFKRGQYLLGGILFEYEYEKDIKTIGLLSADWLYDRMEFSGDFDKLYRVDRNDLDIFFYKSLTYEDTADKKVVVKVKGMEDNPPSVYEAYITHPKMAKNKIYVLTVTGFDRDEFKKLLGSIKLGNPYKN
ncbi:MAG: hypothetical protein ACRBBR_06525 [Cellvibrionaceae bacterium]